MIPSPERLAGSGLAIAAVTIVALAALALAEIDREIELNREAIAATHVKESLDTLRLEMAEIAHSARLLRLFSPNGD